MTLETVVGLEVHAELATKSKLFCACRNEYGGDVNGYTCPYCLAMPGTLPVVNEQALRLSVLAGKALQCEIHPTSRFDRKQYFYPDLPGGYQITQFEHPLCENGYLEFETGGALRVCRINRIHAEADAAKLLHGSDGQTRIDFNRAGVPLIEIVTEPDLRGPDEAKAFLDALRAILLTLGVSDCRMQEGSLRCDVNVSMRPEGAAAMGTRVEMKNVNSFAGVSRAIRFEAERQRQLLSQGGSVQQETRRWDDEAGMSLPLRSKEDARDYRYIPEPDLPPVLLEAAWLEAIVVPELPRQKCVRYQAAFGLSPYESGLLSVDRGRSAFFEACVAAAAPPKAVSRWMLGDAAKILGARKERWEACKLTPEALAELIALVGQGVISASAGKRVLTELFETGRSPREAVDALGLAQISDDSALRLLAHEIMEKNPKSVTDFRAGKTAALGFLVGQCMRASGGKANPEQLGKLLMRLLQPDPT